MNKNYQKGQISQQNMKWMILIGLIIAITILGYYTLNLPDKHNPAANNHNVGNVNHNETNTTSSTQGEAMPSENTENISPENTTTDSTEEKPQNSD